jgi:hypothetical protein
MATTAVPAASAGCALPSGTVATLGAAAAFVSARGVAFDALRGRLLVADAGAFSLFAVSVATGAAARVGGTGAAGSLDGDVDSAFGAPASFSALRGLAVAPGGLVVAARSVIEAWRETDGDWMAAVAESARQHHAAVTALTS